MKQYLQYLSDVRNNGTFVKGRTAEGYYSTFGYQMRFNLLDGFPIPTTKFVSLKSVATELFWFLSGSTDASELRNMLHGSYHHGKTIWDEWVVRTPLPIADIIDQLIDAEIPQWLYDITKPKPKGFDVKYNSDETVARITTPSGSFECDGTIVNRDYNLISIFDNIPYVKEYRKSGAYKEKRQRSTDYYHLLDLVCSLVNIKSFTDELGPIYGSQWRNFDGVDQIEMLRSNLKVKTMSRRHIVSAWSPKDLPDEDATHIENIKAGKAVLPWCHTLFQCHVVPATREERIRWAEYQGWLDFVAPELKEEYFDTKLADLTPSKKLSLQVYLRSNDVFLGAGYNIPSYALLLTLLANDCGFMAGDLIYSVGDAHLYENHLEQTDLLLTREPKELPKLHLRPSSIGKSIFEMGMDDLELKGYNPHPAIKAPVAI